MSDLAIWILILCVFNTPHNERLQTEDNIHEKPTYVYKSVLSPREVRVKLSNLFSQLRNNVKQPYNLWVLYCLFSDMLCFVVL